MHKLVNALIVSDLALDNKRINLDNKTLDLSSLNLNNYHVEILASAIESNIDIKELNISHLNINLDTLKKICNGISKNGYIQSLDISYNNLNEEHVKVLADALKDNTSLRKLELTATDISDKFNYLYSSLVYNKNIKHLHLNHCNLAYNHYPTMTLELLAEVLRANNTVVELRLSHNCCSVFNLESLFKILKDNNTLKLLDISYNMIGINNESMESLIDMLKYNRTIETLFLGSNLITQFGLNGLSEAIKCNTSLISLHLDCNSFHYDSIDNDSDDEDGIRDNKYYYKASDIIADIIKENKIISTLDLEYNGFNTKETHSIIDALKENKIITKLIILSEEYVADPSGTNKTTLDDAVRLSEYIDRNQKLNIQEDKVKIKELCCELASSLALDEHTRYTITGDIAEYL